jgi:hypothetical protein
MFDPLGSTNARIIRNKIPKSEDRIFKVGQIARSFVEGPDHIYVYVTQADYDEYDVSAYHDPYNPSDLSFRFSTQSNTSLRTWAIYGDIYSGVDRCVLRSAIWNLEKGLEESENSINITARYVDYDCGYVESVQKQWEALHMSLMANFLPETNRQPNQDILPGSEWEQCALFLRLAREIEIRWLNSSRNDKLKESAFALAAKVEQALVEHQASHPEAIEALVMEYDNPNPQALAFLQD